MEKINNRKLRKFWNKFKNNLNENYEDKILTELRNKFKLAKESNIISEDNWKDINSILFLLQEIIKSDSGHISFTNREDLSRLKRLVDDLEVNRFLSHRGGGLGGNLFFELIDKEKSIKYLLKRIEEEISFLRKEPRMKKFSWLFQHIRELIIGVLIIVIAGLILYILIGKT